MAVALLQVHRRPTVGVLSTGDEVVDPATQRLEAGQIRDANRAMLVAASQQAGAHLLDLGIARDTEGHVEACLQKAVSQQVDVLITTGHCIHCALHSGALTCSSCIDHEQWSCCSLAVCVAWVQVWALPIFCACKLRAILSSPMSHWEAGVMHGSDSQRMTCVQEE